MTLFDDMVPDRYRLRTIGNWTVGIIVIVAFWAAVTAFLIPITKDVDISGLYTSIGSAVVVIALMFGVTKIR
jgi:hypothetical protein